MTFRRGLIAAALTAFLLFGVAIGFFSTTWKGRLATPATVPSVNVSYKCGSLWGSGYVRGPSPAQLAYPVTGTPCDTRSSQQVMDVVDVALAIAGLVVVLGWSRWRRDSSDSYGAVIAASAPR